MKEHSPTSDFFPGELGAEDLRDRLPSVGKVNAAHRVYAGLPAPAGAAAAAPIDFAALLGQVASRQAAADGAAAPVTGFPAGGAAPLPGDLRGDLERTAGRPLGGVRIHTGADSASAAAGLRARAFTVGQDIHFAAGQYQPDTPAGRQLIAHEVAHTLQDGGAPTVHARLEVADEISPAERAADQFAAAFAAGLPAAPIAATATPAIHRWPDTAPAPAAPAAASSGRGPATGGTASPASPAHVLAAPPEVDFGDQEVGRQTVQKFHVWNIGGQRGQLEVRGPQDQTTFRIAALPPATLLPTREPGAAMQPPIEISYVPRESGSHRASTSITLVIPGAGGETAVVALNGLAHAAGEPTHHERAMCGQRSKDRQRDSAQRAQRSAELASIDSAGTAAEARDPRKAVVYLERLVQAEEAERDAATALARVFRGQYEGVNAARSDAASYARRQPSAEASLVLALARSALEIATAGIASALAARIAGGLASLAAGEKSEAVKGGVKKALEIGGKQLASGVGAARGESQGAGDDGATGNALHDYFDRQSTALGETADQRADLVTAELRALRPLLHTGSDEPIRAARTVERAARAEVAGASGMQRAASAGGWIRLVAQSSLGEVHQPPGTDVCGDPLPGRTSTDLRDATQEAGIRRPLDARDGLLDIVFDADLSNPAAPVAVVRATMTGVSQETVNYLQRRGPLLDAGIPARAYGRTWAKDGDPNAIVPITVTRDESGGIQITDDWSGYLTGKGGSPVAGGRKLIEDEILARKLPVPIRTDDATGTRSR